MILTLPAGISFQEIYEDQSRSLLEKSSRNGLSRTNVEIKSRLKQETENLGFEDQDVAQYVKQQQTLDREEGAVWRDVQKRQAQNYTHRHSDCPTKVQGLEQFDTCYIL